MSLITVGYTIGFYLAGLVLITGLAYRIWQYATTPSPLRVPITPAPVTRTGVALRLGREVVFFQSLFKSNKWIWVFAILFHVAFLLVVLWHLRAFIEHFWHLVYLPETLGATAGYVMIGGLSGLWARRFLVERVRYITSPSDHLMLALLAVIGISGLIMNYQAQTDLVAVKEFFRGLMLFDWQPLPGSPLLLVHLGGVIVLMIVFPFSKLLHAPGAFFSPSHNQIDNPREKRHVADWAAPLDSGRED